MSESHLTQEMGGSHARVPVDESLWRGPLPMAVSPGEAEPCADYGRALMRAPGYPVRCPADIESAGSASIVSAVVLIVAVSLSLLGCQRPPAVIGLPSGGSPSTLDTAVLSGLHALGYVEGRNLIVERRYSWGQPERLPDL